MHATFSDNGITYRGDLDDKGNGTLFGHRTREPGDARMPGSLTTVVVDLTVEKFQAVIHGDKRYVLGKVTVPWKEGYAAGLRDGNPGRTSTRAKAKAARANGAKGGRPRKQQ